MADYEKNEDLSQKTFPLSVNEGALALGMYENKSDTAVDYQIDRNGTRNIPKLDEMNSGMLANKFRKQPTTCLAYARMNLLRIMTDPKIKSVDERKERLSRYLDAYFTLQLKLDHAAFPPDDEVRLGVPDYVPDGMTDMGGDPETDPTNRNREKIRVDKKELFALTKPFFEEVLSRDFSGATAEQAKMFIAKEVARFVYTKLPFKNDPFPNAEESIRLDRAHTEASAVCRHHALYTQVLLQSFGITGRLLKCDTDFHTGRGLGAHAANLIRINNTWYLLDVSNPEFEKKGDQTYFKNYFIARIPQDNVDTNRENYTWKTLGTTGERRTYKSRNNMYTKNEDNRTNKV